MQQMFFNLDSDAIGGNVEFDQDTSQDYIIPSDDSEPSDDEYTDPKRKKDIPDDILWNMCQTGVSFSVLSQILQLSYSVVGQNENFRLSSSHLFKRYQKIAEAKEINYNCEISNKQCFGTICFDHHSMKKISGKFTAKEHRLAVLWHSDCDDKLISIDKITDKSGRSQTESIMRACETFNIGNHQIVAVSCDNENTNTGNEMGTCILLEEELLKDLLRLMCRHHIYEINLKSVYKFLFPSDAPTNLFHTILAEVWSELKSSNFPFEGFNGNDEEIMEFGEEQSFVYNTLRERSILELQTHSNHPFVRDDYREITSVSLKFLTGLRKNLTKSNQVQFNTLQNPSNARFMASSIQGLNCFLFRYQLNWDSPQRENILAQLPRFCLYISLIYVRYWNIANSIFDAGLNDLKFLKELEEYGRIDREVSDVAIEAITRHLYYLGEELIVLSLFSDKMSANEKNDMAQMLLELDNVIPGRNFRSNHIKFNEDIDSWTEMRVSDFLGERSLHLFQLFNIEIDFLRINADMWEGNAEYLAAKSKLKAALVCVNDGTERVISTCKFKYKRQRCKNDESFQRSMLGNYMKKLSKTKYS